MKFNKLISVIIINLLIFSNAYLLYAQKITYTNDASKKGDYGGEWYQLPQIYNMVAFSPKDIEKYHITVNGLWNGFIGENLSSPFALGRLVESVYSGRNYESDKEFVDIQHEQGMIVPATILTIQGHRSFQQDSFDEFASRNIQGTLCPWDVEANSYWMNSLNPGFIDWCIQHGKKAIDAGSDLIVLDEIQGNSFIPLYQWASQYTGIPAPGFSNTTIEGFRQYLSDTYDSEQLVELFDIQALKHVDLKTRISNTTNLIYEQRIQVDPLIKEYQYFLEYSNYEAKKHLILSLRYYAKEQNKELVISANSYALGTPQSFGFWAKGLIFADLIDLFTFENTYTGVQDQTIPNFFRTKWLAWERLAYAATNAPAVILIDTATLEAINNNLFPLFGFSNALGILCAEAYANKGSFVNYHFPLFNRENNWKKVEQIQKFIMTHKELFNYSNPSFSNVGILFLYSEGMRTHINTYLGCAQALAESNIPFEVIFDGDGLYLNSSLSVEEIDNFKVIIIPSVSDITESQKQVIKEYVEHGGKAVVFDAKSLGLEVSFGEWFYGDGLFYIFDENIGKKYFETYEESYQQILSSTIKNYADSIIQISPSERKILGIPYYQEQNNQVILHLINYDHIGFFDFIWPHSNIKIQLRKPSNPVTTVLLKNIDGTEFQLDFTLQNNYLNFTVPKLKDYAIIIIK